MRIALAQINSSLGNFELNQNKIIEFVHRAKDRRCDLVVFPEMSLFGYRPSDLLERRSIVKEQLKAINKIQKALPKETAVIFGLVTENQAKDGKPYFNSAIFLKKGEKAKVFHKALLPTYDVFDEYRHLEMGDTSKNVFSFKGKKILVTICEDIWAWDFPGYKNQYSRNPLKSVKGKVDLVINISASPFSLTKHRWRDNVTKFTAKHFKAPLIYVNMVGAQDELIFDGGSFALSAKGEKLAQCVQFSEDLNVVDLSTKEGGVRAQKLSEAELLRQSLVLGIRDFVSKVGFKQVHLGLSGGIDSAVVACLAVDALRPSQVSAFALPGPFSSDQSFSFANKLAKNLGIEFNSISIKDIYESLIKSLEKNFGKLEFSTLHENLQARLRANILMAFANHRNSLLLSTSNKSEYATGYCTLYGDMCGGLAPIGDLLKGQVYALAQLYNKERELIPNEIIERPPTAELRPNQKDQDTLPPYEKLDQAVWNIVEQRGPVKNEIDRWLLSALLRTEFKRWQAPPILRVSEHAFGRGRNFPIAHQSKW